MATATTSKPRSFRRSPRTRCSSYRPGALASPLLARPLATANCLACCGASGSLWSRFSPCTGDGLRSGANWGRYSSRDSNQHGGQRMRLIDYLDKGASLGTEAPCLTMAGRTLNYRDVQKVSWRVGPPVFPARGRPGEEEGRLSADNPNQFFSLFRRHLARA